MVAQTPRALLTIVLGALEAAGAVQELVFRGILQSLNKPLCIGAIGTVAGVFVLATGIALLLRSPRIDILIPAKAWLSVPPSLFRASFTVTLDGQSRPRASLFRCCWQCSIASRNR